MGLRDWFFKKQRNNILPCTTGKDCPYEYDKQTQRDIEGMPFIKNDDRSCPTYGHICPEFMEDLGLTVEDLKIRSVIHCGGLLDHFVQEGTIERDSEQYKLLKVNYKKMTSMYPRNKYPQYY